MDTWMRLLYAVTKTLDSLIALAILLVGILTGTQLRWPNARELGWRGRASAAGARRRG